MVGPKDWDRMERKKARKRRDKRQERREGEKREGMMLSLQIYNPTAQYNMSTIQGGPKK